MEGPGQGGVIREQGKHFTYQWEKPVSAILDALQMDDITIIGASLGGMLAPRAAAFDSRIQRVIGWSVFPNFLDVGIGGFPKPLKQIVKWSILHNLKGPMNALLRMLMKREKNMDWAMRHGMYAYEAKTPFEYVKKLNDFQMMDIADRITQVVLVIGAAEDHFIKRELYKDELDALVNVRSVTYRLFTKAEEASNHCNVGNSKLVFDTMMSWIDLIKSRESL